MLKFSVRSFLTLVAVAAILVAPVANAQESDLYTTVASSANPATPGELVDYTVVYGNNGPNDAVAPILNLNLPPNQPADLQAYIDGDQDALDLIDGILGASITVTHGDVGFFFGSTCEGLLIQVDIDADLSGFGAGASGDLTYTMPMPEMPPSNPTVGVEGIDDNMLFSRGACDSCEDMAGTCFGPRVSATPAITALIQLVNDGTGEATDGCEPFVDFTPGNIAWIDRGSCNFDLKAANAQQAGATAVVIGQNVGDDRLGGDGLLNMACTDFCGLITVPVAFVSQNNNIATQAALAAGDVMGVMGAVEAEAITTWSHMWENTATPTDIDPDNDDWYETTDINFITGDVPVAAFSYDPEFPAVFQPITFTDTSTGDPAITAWAWDFGNGATSTDQNPLNTYETTGTYTVSLTVTNDLGSDTATMDIFVRPLDGPLVGDKVFFAAAAAAEGSGGSFWSTTVEVNNRGAGVLSYRIAWLDRNADNSSPTVMGPFTLGAGMSARYPNIVGDLFGGENLAGGLVFLVDPSESAVLTSRTFNTFDNGTLAGTFGQSIPAVSEDDLIPENTRVRFIQLSEDDMARTNIGFANGTDANIRIMAEFFLADGTSLGTDFIDLAPYSVNQWNSAFTKVTADMVADGYVDVWTETPGGMFTSYASVVGNDDFNDPTTVLAQ